MNFFKPKFWDKNRISFFSILLLPFSSLVRFFNFLKGSFTKTHKFSIPIICVGNIYLGGTGKTPLSIEIFSILKKLNMNPAFVRKQYDLYKDEADFQKSIGPVYQSKKRIDAVKEAKQNNVDVVILDDGFQDFSINKNLSIICFNEKQWIGNGFTIPAGPLRNSLSALKKADCVIINGKKNKNIENKIFSKNGEIKIFYVSYKLQNANEFKNKKVVAFAGIGNSQNFFDLIEKNNIEMVKTFNYPDHYNFNKKDILKLKDIAKKMNAFLVTTEKDYLRISSEERENIIFLGINLEINNKENFINELKKII